MHVVRGHRDARDIGVFFERVVDVPVLGQRTPFHIDDAELGLAGQDLERSDIVGGDRFVGNRLHLDGQRALGAVGVDDQVVRLLAVSQGDRKSRQDISACAAVLPDA